MVKFKGYLQIATSFVRSRRGFDLDAQPGKLKEVISAPGTGLYSWLGEHHEAVVSLLLPQSISLPLVRRDVLTHLLWETPSVVQSLLQH